MTTTRTTRSFRSQLRGFVRLFACFSLAACAAGTDVEQADAPETDRANLGVLREAIKDGGDVPEDDYGGVVRLWETNTQFNEFRQMCTGVLYRNDLVLTAKHCVIRKPTEIAYGWPDTATDTSLIIVSSAGGQFVAWGQGAPMLSPNGADVAAFYLSQSIPVRSNGEIIDNGWTRALGSVSPQTAVGVYGFGFTIPGETSDVCVYQSQETGDRLRGCLADPTRLTMGADYPRLVNGTLELDTLIALPGDSGGMTTQFDWNESDLADMRLVGINSRLMGCADGGCGHASVIARVDYLGEWFASM